LLGLVSKLAIRSFLKSPVVKPLLKLLVKLLVRPVSKPFVKLLATLLPLKPLVSLLFRLFLELFLELSLELLIKSPAKLLVQLPLKLVSKRPLRSIKWLSIRPVSTVDEPSQVTLFALISVHMQPVCDDCLRQKYTDLKIVCRGNGCVFHVHRLVVCTQSKYLRDAVEALAPGVCTFPRF